MEKIFYEEIGCQKWQEYIKSMYMCPYTYTSDWMEFQKEYVRPNLLKNASYLVLQDKSVIAVVKIFVERQDEFANTISWEQGYLEAPYIDKRLSMTRQEKILKHIMESIDTCAIQNNCKKALFKFEVLGNPDYSNYAYNYNWLTRFGFIDYSSCTQIINLNDSITDMEKAYRKGTKSEIKKGRNLKIITKDASNVELKDIEDCKDIYEYDAGRTTRVSELISYYYELVHGGKAILKFAELDGVKIATMLSAYFHETAYYLLYAEKTDIAEKTSPGYVLQDSMIKMLKTRGIMFYDMGEQVFGKTHYSVPDIKALNISLYKRGFGGYVVPMFRGVKEY